MCAYFHYLAMALEIKLANLINNNSEHLRICERGERGDVGSTICRALQWRNSFRANTAYKLVGPGV